MTTSTQQQEEKTFLIAVYGTLKKGESNHDVISSGELLGTFKTEPKYTMYSMGGFPAITRNGNTSLTIEVYRVDEITRNRVYRLEGYSGIRDSSQNWYDTFDIETPFKDEETGEMLKAEIFYFKNELSRPIVESGCWGRNV